MKTVAIIAGGPSSEAAVSRTSAVAVRGALETAGYEPLVLELDTTLPARLAELGPAAVFPVAHGPQGEDGCLQGLLEVLALPYVGCDVRASALAASKPDAKLYFRQAGLPVADDRLIARGDDLAVAAREARMRLGRSVVVKPAAGGSAIGVSRVTSEDDDAVLVAALTRALNVDPLALVERWMVGQEITCGVLDVDERGPVALPPTAITSRAADWYDFTSRYAPGGSAHECPAQLPSPVIRRIQSVAEQGFRALGARDLGRLDYVVAADGTVTLLELNSLPGMTATSLFPEAAAVAGIPFPQLCSQLVERAIARPPRIPPVAVPMPE